MNRYAKIILSFGFLSRLTYVWRDFDSIPLIGDCFYNFFVAKNLALGNGLTFDGKHLTNGFHPLLTLLMAGVYCVFPNSESAPLRTLLLIHTFLSLFSAIFLYKVIRQEVNERAATIFLLLFYTSIYSIATDMNGLDTCLNTFLLSAALLFYFTKLRGRTDDYLRRFLVFSILCGLLALSRLDNFAFILGLLFDHLFIDTSDPRMRFRKIRGLLIHAFVILLFVGPWFFYNLKYFGDLMPISGQTVRLISVLDIPSHVTDEAELFDLSSDTAENNEIAIRDFYDGQISPIVYLKCLGSALGTIVAFGLPLAADIITNLRRLRVGGWDLAAVGTLLIFLLFAVLVWRLRTKVKSRDVFIEPFRFLLLSFFLFLGFYLYIVLGYMFYYRYMFPVILVSKIFLSIYIDRLLPVDVRLFRRERLSIMATAFVLIYLVQVPMFMVGFKNTYVRTVMMAGDWVERNVPQGSLIGVFQSGVIINFCSADFLVLENKLNPEIGPAFRDKRMFDYLLEKGVDYVMDEPRVLQVCLIQRSHQDLRKRLERVYKGFFWIYKIKDGAGAESDPN